MSRRVLILGVIVAVFVVLGLLSASSAIDPDGPFKKEDRKDQNFNKRDLDVTRSDKQLKIVSTSVDPKQKTAQKLQFMVRIEKGVDISFMMFQASKDARAGFRFRAHPRAIVEYVDSGLAAGQTCAGYANSTNYLQWYTLWDKQFTPFSYNLTTKDGVKMMTAKTSTIDKVATFTFSIAGELLKTGKIALKPQSLKIDLDINNYPYRGNQSSLALKTFVISSAARSLVPNYNPNDGTNNPESAIDMPDDSASGSKIRAHFSWLKEAIADGQTISVMASSFLPDNSPDARGIIDDDMDKPNSVDRPMTASMMYHSFCARNAKTINWDPSTGLRDDTLTQSAAFNVSPSIALTFLISTLLAFLFMML